MIKYLSISVAVVFTDVLGLNLDSKETLILTPNSNTLLSSNTHPKAIHITDNDTEESNEFPW